MKILFAVAMALMRFAVFASAQTTSHTPAFHADDKTLASQKPETPFYCNRSAILPEQRKRKAELDQALFSSSTAIRELKDGFEFDFPADAATFQAAAEWAMMERVCCPFFDISLRLEREGGSFSLRLSGREGVKQFIEADFPNVRSHKEVQGHKDNSAVQGERQ